ncbi:MAG: PQQ-binding-like beta-propeller repeat protein [Planctomycetaceae bacterium]
MTRQFCTGLLACVVGAAGFASADDKPAAFDPTAAALKLIEAMDVGPKDWPMWGGSNARNNTPEGTNIPTDWDVEAGENILWKAPLGSQTYGNPTVANGKVFVGTNNQHGYIKRYPSEVDLGCFLCFDALTGKFLWQHSSPKLPTGRVHDWPEQGICCAPLCDGNKVWFVSSRGEVLCLDSEGFHDGENDGPFKSEDNQNSDEADIIWKFDMMGVLGTSQHNMCSCSPTFHGDLLFINTSNGVDESHINIPAPEAPSFIVLDKNSGKLLWTDKSPGLNILHGQWSSPTYGEPGGVPQVIFAGGDGWVYSFAPEGDGQGTPSCSGSSTPTPKRRSGFWADAAPATTSSPRP